MLVHKQRTFLLSGFIIDDLDCTTYCIDIYFNTTLFNYYENILESMAEKFQITLIPDDIDKLLFIEVIESGQMSYPGFKVEYLAQKLSDLGRELVSCTKCFGIARDAFHIGEEIFCQSCCIEQRQCASVAQKVRNSVAKLRIRCPLLRDCNWIGCLLEGEMYLRECDYILIGCPEECENVIERNKA